MSGFSNRLIYDDCAYCLRLSDSVGPMKYRLYNGPFENDLQCYNNAGMTNSNNWNSIGFRTDIESDLRNQITKQSLCINDKHKPCNGMCDNPKCNVGVTSNPFLCERSIIPNNLPKVFHCGF